MKSGSCFALVILSFLLHGVFASGEVLERGHHIIRGEKVLREPLLVKKGASLYVAPGSRIYIDIDNSFRVEGVLQALYVSGKLIVDGREGSPVVVTGVRGWGEIYIDGAVAAIRRLRVEKAEWAFHIHDSFVIISDSEITDSHGGVRTYNDDIYIQRCKIGGNDIGIRYWEGGPEVRDSRITGNRVGIFFREGRSTALFRGNLIDNLEYNLRIGDFASGMPDLRGNDWGKKGPEELMEKVFDGRNQPITIDQLKPILVEH